MGLLYRHNMTKIIKKTLWIGIGATCMIVSISGIFAWLSMRTSFTSLKEGGYSIGTISFPQQNTIDQKNISETVVNVETIQKKDTNPEARTNDNENSQTQNKSQKDRQQVQTTDQNLPIFDPARGNYESQKEAYKI